MLDGGVTDTLQRRQRIEDRIFADLERPERRLH
jgi:hypothetical protein